MSDSGLPTVIALFGPTGVGKTAVALALAELLRQRGEDPVAISADALQVYRGLERLTGVPEPSELNALEHRLVSFRNVGQTFSAGAYAELAHSEIDAALVQGRVPIVVGGTGLYLQAALCDLDLRPAPPPEVRARLQSELESRGADALHQRLAEAAPEAAAQLSATDGRRIVRALELIEIGEQPPARGEDSRLWTATTRHPTSLFGLVSEREALYARINDRVTEMVTAGAVDEVVQADARGASQTARKALGFAELMAGDVEAMRRNTRRYARRQLTWMRRLEGIQRIDVTDRPPTDVAGEIDRLRHADRAQA